VPVFAQGTIYVRADFNKWTQLMLDNKPEIIGHKSGTIDPDHAQGSPGGSLRSGRLSTTTEGQEPSKSTRDETAWQIHNHICSNLAGGMTVFLVASEDGNVSGLGIGPDHMRTHDTIVRFTTPAVPMIVRESESCSDKHHLVGATRLSRMPCFTEVLSEEGREWHKKFTLA